MMLSKISVSVPLEQEFSLIKGVFSEEISVDFEEFSVDFVGFSVVSWFCGGGFVWGVLGHFCMFLTAGD